MRATCWWLLDNTWSAGVYFDAFAHGVDITMQALTKYVGGHSDLLMGSVTVKDPKLYQQLGATHQLLGCGGFAGRLQSGFTRHADHGGAPEAHRGFGLADCTMVGEAARDGARTASGAGRLTRP